MTKPPAWLTRANALTAVRVLLAPTLFVCVREGAELAAACVFWAAVATDLLDGRVARRFGEATPYGRSFDHAADAFFVSVGAASLIRAGEVPWPLPFLIAAAFLQYAWGGRVSSAGPPRKSRLGHWNGIAYYVIVAVPVMRDALALGWPPVSWVRLAGWLLVASTVVSMGSRLRLARAGAE